MENLFEQSSDFTTMLNENKLSTASLQPFDFFVKGDVSGIQEFIFSVKSEGAAQTLKGRSYFIQALSELCLQHIRTTIVPEPMEVLYNGGGNFFFFTTKKAVDKFDEVQRTIWRDCAQEEFYLALTAVKFASNDLQQFGEKLWKPVNAQSSADKLTKFIWEPVTDQPSENKKTISYHSAFNSFAQHLDSNVEEGQAGEQKWQDFTRKFIDAEGCKLIANPGKHLGVRRDGVDGFDTSLYFGEGQQFKSGIVNKLPRWDTGGALRTRYSRAIDRYLEQNPTSMKPTPRSIIEFGHMAAFASSRTGTEKLAVLKMDVDNLGSLFEGRQQIAELQAISKSLGWFFNQFMKTMWDSQFTHHPEEEGSATQSAYKDNLYIVFSGGDDCFVVGAWDAVFEFAKTVQAEFASFEKALKNRLSGLPNLTLSASLTVIDSKFPVVRFAEMAEDALKDAKHFSAGKNRISVFGQVLRWEEFIEAEKLAKQLRQLILKAENAEPRAILERIKKSGHLFEKMERRVHSNKLASVWRLFYYLRNVKEANRDEIEKIVTNYSRALVKSFGVTAKTSTKSTAHLIYPVAARWAEFLTRV